MKTLLFTLALAVGGGSVANAQYYRPSAVGPTAVLGAVAGALIGGHNNDRWAEGAIIGGVAGAVVGAIADDSRSNGYYSQREIAPVTVAPCAPTAYGAPEVYGQQQVVYVSPPPPTRVVYVQSYPRAVYAPSPVVYVGGGWNNNRYRGHDYRYDHHRYDHRRGDRDRRR